MRVCACVFVISTPSLPLGARIDKRTPTRTTPRLVCCTRSVSSSRRLEEDDSIVEEFGNDAYARAVVFTVNIAAAILLTALLVGLK